MGKYIEEAKDIVKQPGAWFDAAHWGANEVMERQDAKTIASGGKVSARRALATKVLGSPLQVGLMAAQAAYILSDKERIAKTRTDYAELANKSAVARGVESFFNMPETIIGGAQAFRQMAISQSDAEIAKIHVDAADRTPQGVAAREGGIQMRKDWAVRNTPVPPVAKLSATPITDMWRQRRPLKLSENRMPQ